MLLYNRARTVIKPEAEWLEFDPVLADGEIIGVEYDDITRFKVGNGIAKFTELAFMDEDLGEVLSAKLDSVFPVEHAGKVLGIAEDGNVVPLESIPTDFEEIIPRIEAIESKALETDSRIDEMKTVLDGTVEDVAVLTETSIAVDGALTTLQADVETLRADIVSQDEDIAHAVSRVDLLINELSANPEYTPAAEVIDIRAGYDGIVHQTAGAAVRAIGEDLLAIKETMQTIDPDDLGLEQDEVTMLVYPTFKGIRSTNGIPLAGGTGGGGGGGGGATTIIKLRSTTPLNKFTVAAGNPALITYTFSSVDSDDGTPTGNGTASYYINEELVETGAAVQGDNQFDVAPYLKSGENSIRLNVADVDGNSRSLYWTITSIQIRIESSFDYTLAYPGNVTFKYTAIGDAEKTAHFILDGVEQEPDTGIIASGRQNTRTFENLTHGLHVLEAYLTAVVNGSEVTSNKLVYDVIVTRENSLEPIISINYPVTSLLQGELVDIPYIVYDPLTTESTITLEISHEVDGETKVFHTENRVVGNSLQHWTTRHYPLGKVTFKVSLREISRSVTIHVDEFKLPIEAVTNDMELYLSAAGRSNNEVNPAVWSYKDITTTFNNV